MWSSEEKKLCAEKIREKASNCEKSQSKKEACEKLETNLSALFFQSQVQPPVEKQNKTRGTYNKPCFVADMTWGAINQWFHKHLIRGTITFQCQGKGPANKCDEFLVPKGGGGIFNPKIHIADFENFVHEIDKKKSNFRVQGMFFNNCIDIN